MRNFVSVVFILASMCALVMGLSLGGYELYNYFAPKYTAIDNKVFHESQAYNDGMIRDLENLEVEYNSTDAGGKMALKAIILHRFSVYPQDKLPYDLRSFYENLRGSK